MPVTTVSTTPHIETTSRATLEPQSHEPQPSLLHRSNSMLNMELISFDDMSMHAIDLTDTESLSADSVLLSDDEDSISMHRNESSDSLDSGYEADLESLAGEVEDHWQGYAPEDGVLLSVGDVTSVRAHMLSTTLTLVEKLKDQYPDKTQVLTKQTTLLNGALDLIKGNCEDTTPIIGKDNLKAITPKDLPKRLYGRLEHSLGLEAGTLRDQWRDTYIRHSSDNQKWQPVSHDVTLGASKFTSTMTPVNEHFDMHYGQYHKDYGETGLSSMVPRLRPAIRDNERENLRATNFWSTELKGDDGQPVFKAFRSGAIGGKFLKEAKTETELKQQNDVAKANATEIIEAALIEELKEHPDDDMTVLDVISIDLMSAINEEGMIKRQEDALIAAADDINANGIDILRQNDDPDEPGLELQKIKPRIHVYPMRSGVNNIGGLQKSQETTNAAQIRRLKPVMERRLASLKSKGPEIRFQQAKNLWDQVQKLTDRTNSYKFASQLANLGFLVGIKVHFNCKSGKDRTGLMDAESKFLAYQLAENAKKGDATIPSYSLSKNDERRPDLLKLIFEGGIMDISKLNTLVKSLKVAPMKKTLDHKLVARFGGKDVLKWIQGGKMFTSIDKM